MSEYGPEPPIGPTAQTRRTGVTPLSGIGVLDTGSCGMPGNLRNPVAFRLRAWASTRELTSPPDAAEPTTGPGRPRDSGLRGLAGYGCVGVAALLVIAGAAFGASPHSASAALHDAEAWLAHARPRP